MSGIGHFSLPLAEPLETAAGPITTRSGFLIRLGEDPIGIGEATPLAGWTEDLSACRDALADGLAEADAADSATELPQYHEYPAARHGLELALLDRAARARGEPLYRFLGGDQQVSTIPVNATVGDIEHAATVAASRSAEIAGFPAIKLKVGSQSVDDDIGRIEAVREVVGTDIELRVDVNGAWSRDQARVALEAFERVGVSLVEQPLSPADLDGHAELREYGVDIAIDESLRNYDLEEILAAQTADVIMLKPMVLGGVARANDLATRIRDAGLKVIVTTTVDAAVARTAAVHLAAALEMDRACGLATADRLARDVGTDPAPVVDGGISVPQGSGHGVGLTELE